MPTLSFFFYLLALALVCLFRLTYRGWFGPYILWVMIAAPILILILSLPAMLNLELEQEAEPFVTKGSRSTAVLNFKTRRWMPVACVKVWLEIKNCYTDESVQTVLSYYGLLSGKQSVRLPTDLCGLLTVRILRWESRDMLGLIRIRKTCPDPVSCTVLPLPVAPEQPVDFDAALKSFARMKPKYGGGFAEDHDLRDYRPGDTGNSIHWKLSSKTDKLIVREALEPDNKDIYLVLSLVGKDDRGLEVLYWLSLELCRREQAHKIVANRLYEVSNESACSEAFSGVLSTPIGPPCSFDRSKARSIFCISGGEVTAL